MHRNRISNKDSKSKNLNDVGVGRVSGITDNVFLLKSNSSIDYLAIQIRDSRIMIYRYRVSGRCDLYSFQEGDIKKIIYFTDYGYPLMKSIKMFINDLKRKQVKKLIDNFGNEIQRKRIKKFIGMITKSA